MKLLVVLQTHSKGDNHIYEGYLPPEHKRYTGASKLETSKRCVRSLIETLNNFSKKAFNFDIKLQIFDDHSDESYLNILRKDIDKALFPVNLTHLDSHGISASILSCYEYGKNEGEELVYFAQDDYLYEDFEIVDYKYHPLIKADMIA